MTTEAPRHARTSSSKLQPVMALTTFTNTCVTLDFRPRLGILSILTKQFLWYSTQDCPIATATAGPGLLDWPS